MSRLKLILLASCCALAGAALIPTGASAACAVSQPSAVSISDSAYDSDANLSPEATSMTVAIDSVCGINFSYGIINQPGLLTGDFLSWFLNVDNNVSTGSSSGFRGADLAVGLSGSAAPTIARWNGSTWIVIAHPVRSSEYGVRTTLDAIAATSGVPMLVAGGASWTSSTTGNSYDDWVPEVLDPWLRITPFFSAASHTAPTTKTKRCRVPSVRGLSLNKAKQKLRKAGCKVGAIRTRKNKRYAGKAFKTSPAKGASRKAGTKVAIYVGKRAAKKSRRASASRLDDLNVVRINQAWARAAARR